MYVLIICNKYNSICLLQSNNSFIITVFLQFITKNQIHWAVQEEMASCLEDVLARRTRCLFLDAYETEKIAPEVARIMAGILNQDQAWIDSELQSLNSTIKNYQL